MDELVAKTLEVEGKNISSKELLELYQYPLQNQGLVDSTESSINRSHRVFIPTIYQPQNHSVIHLGIMSYLMIYDSKILFKFTN